MTEQLHLRKFDMSVIRDDSVVCIIGKRGTGKSVLVRELLYYNQDIPIGTVISPTEGANKFYGNIVPDIFIHDDYSEQIVLNVVKRQRMVMKKVNKEIKKRGASSIDPRTFLLLDDCLYDSLWKRDKQMKYIFMNGRHIRTFLLITMQYVLGIPPELRTNIDYTFIFREPIVSNRQRIYQQYAGMFATFDIFSQVLDATTSNYECLVINNRTSSNKIEDQVFWYKADISKSNFRIGSPEFWALQEEREIAEVSSTDEEDENTFDQSAFRPKRKGPMLSVLKCEG